MSPHEGWEGGARIWRELLGELVALDPERVLYSFEGEEPGARLTLERLDARARHVAAALRRGETDTPRALLVCPPGPDFIAAVFGCLYAEASVLPVPLPVPDRSLATLGTLARQAGINHLVTVSSIPPGLDRILSSTPSLLGVGRIMVDLEQDSTLPEEPSCESRGSDVAVLQPTPLAPDGRGLLRLSYAELLRRTNRLSAFACGVAAPLAVSWIAPWEDLGLLTGVLQPIVSGIGVHQLSALEVMRNPLHWLETISHRRAGISGASGLAYDWCVAMAERHELPALDLEAWEVAWVADAFPPHESLERFAEVFGRCGFRADAFVLCSGVPANAEGRVHGLRSTGFPAHGGLSPGDVKIVSSESWRSCAPGEGGEVWLRTGLGEVYWRHQREPSRQWPAYTSDGGDGPYLRTGQFARWAGARLQIDGAMPHHVDVAGGAIDLSHMEASIAACHPGIRRDGVSVVPLDSSATTDLGVVIELADARPSRGEIIRAIQDEMLEEWGLGARVVALAPFGAFAERVDPVTRRARARAGLAKGSLDAFRIWS